ncbi:MAG: undecaprenyl-diphosphate phosphatase [Candidatus Diapherotrites archaeon]|nr:undecaprenyl-diphosphate phosphatase [Candidatus Diapherotrites archaeon]
MLEYLVFGVLQGIFEWLPVSSEGIITLAAAYIGAADPLQLALCLHLGTVLAVLVYFRKEIAGLPRDKKLLRFLGIATACSLPLGLALYLLIKQIPFGSPVLYLVVGLGLIATGFFVRKKKGGLKTVEKATDLDAVFAGLLQGLAVVPGVSRSGITLFALLSREYSPRAALVLSFLMSVPVVLAANAFILLEGFVLVPEHLLALVPAFVFGILSIEVLLKLAEKVDFSWFAWGFGIISILAFLAA